MVEEVKTIDERMEDIQTALNEYENKSGVPSFKDGAFDDVNSYFEMKRDEINRLGPEDCSEIGIRLSQFSFYLQKLNNTEEARNAWANQQTIKLCSPLLSNYDKYTKYEIKLELIAAENSAVDKLRQIVNYSDLRIKKLQYMAGKVAALADDLKRHGQLKYNIGRSL